MNPLQLLQSTPPEQLHHSLKYIDRNKSLDFVTEALRPVGKSIEKTVEFLYSTEENYDAGKVRNIADFIGGFEGIEKITDEQLRNLDFKDVKAARMRNTRVERLLERSLVVYGPLIGTSVGFTTGLALDGIAPILNIYIGFLVGLTSYVASLLIIKPLSDKIKGDQKPREAYNSLLGKAAQADEFLRVYSIAEKLNYRRQPE